MERNKRDKPNTNQKIIKIFDNNVEINDPKIVNSFNNHFSNIGNNLSTNVIPRLFKIPSTK